jgi:thiosulfate dehydrogenase [quinone] large subunit
MLTMKNMRYSNWQLTVLVILRVLIGWHFLYEGLVKVVNPGWSAASFLQASQGPFADFFKGMASNQGILATIDFCNQWGLVLVGLSLMVGLFSRWACLGGMALLFLYYISNPPFIGLNPTAVAEGSYLIVNKNLIELFALFVLFLFPTDKSIGLGKLMPLLSWQGLSNKQQAASNKYGKKHLLSIILLLVWGISGSYAQKREIGSHVNGQSIGGYHVYFGTIHNHSNVSDGLGTPNEAYYYAFRYSDYDFFGLADHDLMMDRPEWEAIKKAANDFNRDGVFTTFSGFEWSSDVGHVTVINSEEYCSCKVEPENTFRGLLDWVNNHECVAFFNHPGREDVYDNEFNHFTDTPSDKFVGIELWNGRNDFSRYYYNDGYFTDDGKKSFYDEAISRGWSIGAAGSEDNHRGDHGSYTQKRLAILADTLTRSALYDALKARRFYSTLDKSLALSFKVGGNEMGASIASGNYGFIVTASDRENEVFTIVQIYKNGKRLSEWNIIEMNVNVSGTIETSPGDYFYVKITQQDGDEAISSPIFIQ